MDPKTLRQEVGELLDTYCDGCFLKQHHRSQYGKKYAQSFCIKKCTVGQTLKEYGNKLLNKQK